MKKTRSHYTTTLDTALMKRLKHLAVELEKPHNVLLEEAIEDFLKKHTPGDKKPRKQKSE